MTANFWVQTDSGQELVPVYCVGGEFPFTYWWSVVCVFTPKIGECCGPFMVYMLLVCAVTANRYLSPVPTTISTTCNGFLKLWVRGI